MPMKYRGWGHLGKYAFGRPRRKWEDSIKRGLGQIDGEDPTWTKLVQNPGRCRVLVIKQMLHVCISLPDYRTESVQRKVAN